MNGSKDNYVTVEMFNAGLKELRGEIQSLGTEFRGDLKSGLENLRTEIRINTVRIEEVKNSMNWNFATLSIVIAIVGFGVVIAPVVKEIFQFRREQHEQKHDAPTFEEVQRMIDASRGKNS